MSPQGDVTAIWEIERKFLVQEVPPDLDQYPCERIRQGYLAFTDDGTEIRVRHKGDRYYETVKQGEGVRRAEVELTLSREQFEALWPLTEGKRLEKIRYALPFGSRVIEVDVYAGALEGLVTAEVEFPSMTASEDFLPPAWFGREISEDRRYKNRNLAINGLP